MKKFLKIFLILILPLICVNSCQLEKDAPKDRSCVRQGNRKFKRAKWRMAEIDYRKGLIKDSLSIASNYNLANTQYRENNIDAAMETMNKISNIRDKNSDRIYYNKGLFSIIKKNWEQAVNEYENSLLLNPNDLEAKQNYIYAKKMLENQKKQQQQQNQNQNKDQNKNQNQNKDQNKNQNKDQKDQNKDHNKGGQNNNGNDQQNSNYGSGGNKISKQQANQILQAILDQEKKTQDKIKKAKEYQNQNKKDQKNW